MQLIKITEKGGKQVVSAREVFDSMGLAAQHWARWSSKNIVKNEFAIKDEDYAELPMRGSKTKDYAITLDFAKRLAMMVRTEKGEEVRKYFIEMERKAQSAPATVPQTQAEMILSIAQLAVEQERKVSQLDSRVTQLEAKAATRPEYMTIMGYAILCKIQVSLTTAATIGRRASKICKEKGYTIDKIKDPRFGLVGSYPESVLEEVFKQTF